MSYVALLHASPGLVDYKSLDGLGGIEVDEHSGVWRCIREKCLASKGPAKCKHMPIGKLSARPFLVGQVIAVVRLGDIDSISVVINATMEAMREAAASL